MSKNLKILLLNNRVPYPLKDGGAIATFNQIKAYCEHGIDLSVLCLNTNKHFVTNKTINKEFHFVSNFYSVDINTNINPVAAFANLFSHKSYNVERFYSGKAQQKLKQILQSNTFDAIIIENLFMMPYFNICKLYSQAKIVLRQHNVEHQIWERLAQNETHFLKKSYLSILAKKLKKYEIGCLKKADEVWAITKTDENTFRQLNPNGTYETFPAGFFIENTNKVNFKKNTVFHIGSLEWEPNVKGINWFIKNVLPILVQYNPEFQFIIAGKGKTDESKHWNGKNIQFKGEVNNAAHFMQNHGIMVVPLFSGSGIRIKIIEAFKLKIPVVTTTIGLQGIDNKQIKATDNAEEFAKEIITLSTNAKNRNLKTDHAFAYFKSHYLLNNIIKEQIKSLT